MRRFVYYNAASAGVVLDPDAEAFLLAAGITDPTITSAVNDFVIGAKTTTLWSDLYVILPVVGGNSTTTRYCMKTALTKVTWYGGVTHNSDGVEFNGTNGYGEVDWNAPNTYNRTAVESVKDSVAGNEGWSGVFSGQVFGVQLRRTGGGNLETVALGLNTLAAVNISNRPFGIRTMVVEANATNGGKHYHEDVLIHQATPNANPNGLNYFIGALNSSGSPILYNRRKENFFAFGNSLTPTQISQLTTLINNFNTTLGR
jgi:hypothetical protein